MPVGIYLAFHAVSVHVMTRCAGCMELEPRAWGMAGRPNNFPPCGFHCSAGGVWRVSLAPAGSSPGLIIGGFLPARNENGKKRLSLSPFLELIMLICLTYNM